MSEPANIDPVISEIETADAINVSTSTLRRMHSRGEGPPRIQLSKRRIGYRLGDVDEWLRLRASPSHRIQAKARKSQRGRP
jgi:predicted DNA-binding transcriptional regulator AlpA